MKKLIPLLLIILISCEKKQLSENEYQENNSVNYNNKIELEVGKQLKLEIDPSMRYMTNSISTFLNDGEEIISYLGSDSQTIVTFNSESGKLLNKILIENEGPNGVGNIGYASAHYHHSPDSIFLYNRQTSPLYLINSRGEIIQKYKVTDYSGATNFPVPNSSTMSPIHFWKNNLLLSCGIQNYEEDFTGYPSLLKLDLKNGQIDYLSTLPKIYAEAFWGAYFKYDPSITLNLDTEEVIISYPIDHNVYVVNLINGKQEKHFIGSEYFQEIAPYQVDPTFFTTRNPNERDEKENIHAFSTSEYRGIIYDHWRNLFYRVALIRPSIERVLAGDKKFSFSIVVFDKDFQKIGETSFTTDTYDPSSIFLTRDGLAIFRKYLYAQNEDILVFDVFQPSNIVKNE
jgi:hypothetical protein